MAEEKHTVKVELELPEELVNVEEAPASGSESKSKPEEDKSAIAKVTGYKTGELLSAPLGTPKLESAKKPRRSQVRNILLGLALLIMSLVVMAILGFQYGLVVALVGATFISFGTLVRV